LLAFSGTSVAGDCKSTKKLHRYPVYRRQWFATEQSEIRKGAIVELIISNTATGVPDDLFEMINNTEIDEKFSGSSDTRRKTGMGLLIVKEVGALIGINLKVSQSDRTHFYLFFE
jgi:signal transduction histidine kinase